MMAVLEAAEERSTSPGQGAAWPGEGAATVAASDKCPGAECDSASVGVVVVVVVVAAL